MNRGHVTTIYNVKVAGYSIGLTFSHQEALSWLQHSSATTRDKVIVPVIYHPPVDGVK